MCKRPFLVALIAVATAGTALFAQRLGGPGPGDLPGIAQPGPRGGGPVGRQGGAVRPPRDRDQAPQTGTAILRGRVLAADTGAPLRGAQIQISGSGSRSRTALTDANGRFEFRDLPAGSIVVRASKAGYVSQQFGQRSPFSPPRRLTLTDGLQATADFALLRGGVITGRILDEYGEPLANVRVSAMRSEMTPAGRRMSGGARAATTDDTGAFRLFGLAPGAYYVSAMLQAPDGLSAPNGFVTYAPTYFPGTTDAAAAMRVVVSGGMDQPNVDFSIVPTPAAVVSGTVISSSGGPLQATVTLRAAVQDAVGEVRRANSRSDGSFTFNGVPPGNYVLEATGRSRSRDVPADVASMPLAVGGSITGLTIVASRGATVTGTIATDDGSRIDTSGITISAAPLYPLPGRGQVRARVTDAGTFTLEGLAGAQVLRVTSLPAGWILASVTANGVDISDRPLDFRGTERVSVNVVLTSRTARISGSVQGQAPFGAAVLVFPEDEMQWTPQSRLIRLVHAGEKGEFTISGLPRDERYVAAALEYVETGEQLDRDFLARVRPIARSVSFAQSDQAYLELPLQPRP